MTYQVWIGTKDGMVNPSEHLLYETDYSDDAYDYIDKHRGEYDRALYVEVIYETD